jgi:hypothetical protein
MTIKSIECADCGAPVPYGRLACPSCGALLAAVAGGPPPAVRVIERPSPDAPATPETDAGRSQKSRTRTTSRSTPKEPVTREHAGKAAGGSGTSKPAASMAKAPAPTASAKSGRAATNGHAPTVPATTAHADPRPTAAASASSATSTRTAAAAASAAPPVPERSTTSTSAMPVEPSSTSSAPVAAQLAYLVEPSPDAPNYVIPAPVVARPAAVASQPVPAGNGRSSVAEAPVPANGRTYLEPEPPIRGSSGYVIDGPADDDDDDEVASPWPPLLQPEPTIVARPYGESANGSTVGPRPGAYLPPNTSVAAASATPAAQGSSARPTGVPATSGRSVGAPELAGAGAGGATAAIAAKGPTRFDPGATISAAFAAIDRARVAEVAGWFVVAGSTIAMLGFLLPWSVVVIGSNGTGGYLDDWGLASPTHLFVVLGLAGVLALGVLQNPVPAWLRTGVLGLLTGGLLVGLTWPYAIGPLGAELGAMATFIGGFLLIGGGLVAIWATRHAEANPVV